MRWLDPGDISARAQIETRNREVHLPPISVYRWWARRTEAVNGAIVDAVAIDRPDRLLVVDQFAGGGVIPLAAMLRGHRVYTQDVNPWATQGLAAMLGLAAADGLREAAAVLAQRVDTETQAAYGTVLSDGEPGLVSHTFRVASAPCTRCGRRARMFPHALITLLARRERGLSDAFLACPEGHLFRGLATRRANCPTCRRRTTPDAIYTPNRVITCPCGHSERLEARRATSGDGSRSWAQLEVFFCQWRAIERTLDEAGPFICSATRTSLRRLPLS